MPTQLPIFLALAADRKDGGKTKNYVVYEGGGQISVKNDRGENIIKNVILGGNGTIYIADEVAGKESEWVLMPRSMYTALTGTKGKGKK